MANGYSLLKLILIVCVFQLAGAFLLPISESHVILSATQATTTQDYTIYMVIIGITMTTLIAVSIFLKSRLKKGTH